MKRKYLCLSALAIMAMLFLSAGCSSSSTSSYTPQTTTRRNTSNDITGEVPTLDSITVKYSADASSAGEHAMELDGTSGTYSNYRITKTGSPSSTSDNYDFYGENAAVLAKNGATLTLTDSIISTDADYANAVFAYGSTVNVSGCVILTGSRNSGGIMTTGGGTMNATNLNVSTSGNSAAAIRSDRGGGNVTVNGGHYTSSGTGSPAIYSTAAITVSNAELVAQSSQGVVVEGKNSVTLNNCSLSANHRTIHGTQTSRKQAIMVYQSFSGDAAEGKGAFTMSGGSITNMQGDIFFVTNTVADITLTDVDIVNNSTDIFIRSEAAGWGNSGSNGGNVNLYANDQTIDGDFVIDSSSSMNAYLADGTALSGAVNEANSGGKVYVEVTGSSKWTLTGNSYVTALTCGTNNINLNGYDLYVNGTAYTSGSSSTGTAISF